MKHQASHQLEIKYIRKREICAYKFKKVIKKNREILVWFLDEKFFFSSSVSKPIRRIGLLLKINTNSTLEAIISYHGKINFLLCHPH